MRRMAFRVSLLQALLASVAFLCGLCIATQPAQACSLPGNVTHVLDAQAQATDTTSPGEPTLALETIKRGKGAEGCGTAASSFMWNSSALCDMSRRRPSISAIIVSTTSWQVNALVEATPTSGPAWM